MSRCVTGATSLLMLATFTPSGCAPSPKPPEPPLPALTDEPAPPAPAEAPQEQVIAELELGNPSQFARDRDPVYLSYYQLGVPESAEPPSLAVKAGETRVPSQAVDHDADGSADGLLLLVGFEPGEVKSLRIVEGPPGDMLFPKWTQAEFSHKVGGSWRPRENDPKLQEYVGGTFQNVASFTPPPQHTDHSQLIRYEGPGIESDKVGYRIYLDWRNGFDIFGKKLSEPVLRRVGQDGYESYHQMADWGMDILKVGQSLGTGGFGFWRQRKVELVSKVSGWQVDVTNNGNLLSAFRIQYKDWKVDDKTVSVKADFVMTGGSRKVHTRLALSEELPNLAIGLVKHPGTELVQGPKEITAAAFTYLGSWGQQSLAGDSLGMAVLFPRGALLSEETDAQNYVAVVEPTGAEFGYYFLAAWAGEPGGVQTKEQFVSYLEQEVERLTLPPRVRLNTRRSEAAKQLPIGADAALGWAKRLADSELQRKTLSYHHDGWDVNRRRKPKFEYDIVGLQPLAYHELHQVLPEAKYKEVPERVTGSFITEKGQILEYDQASYNIDAVMPGRVLLRLYRETKQEKYKTAASQLRRQLERHPKTSEGAFWHKQRYPWQVWLDGVYMGMPFLAEYSTLFENGASLDEVVAEFVVTRKQLRDPESGLYFHAWDEKKQQVWADKASGRSKYHWGRGLGWFAMALVDTLDHIPESDGQHRQPLLDMVKELAPALAKVQDPETGTWWQILDMPGAPGNYRESTATAMFSYFFTKAVRKGYLPESYQASAVKAYEGLINEFITVHADGAVSMDSQCLVAGLGFGRDGSYRYYMSEPVVENDPKGNGPFILAGVEMYRLLQK